MWHSLLTLKWHYMWKHLEGTAPCRFLVVKWSGGASFLISGLAREAPGGSEETWEVSLFIKKPSHNDSPGAKSLQQITLSRGGTWEYHLTPASPSKHLGSKQPFQTSVLQHPQPAWVSFPLSKKAFDSKTETLNFLCAPWTPFSECF